MAAFADWRSSVPWVMCTLPDRMHGRDSSTEQSELAAETCICWLRSEDFAQTPPAAMHASAARSGNVLAAGRFIAHGDLGKELDAIGGQVGPHSGAPHCRGGGGEGHQNGWSRPVPVREYCQMFGLHQRRGRLGRGAGGRCWKS